jgi:hypothetical protein
VRCFLAKTRDGDYQRKSASKLRRVAEAYLKAGEGSFEADAQTLAQAIDLLSRVQEEHPSSQNLRALTRSRKITWLEIYKLADSISKEL